MRRMQNKKHQGFALIATITIMSLIMMVTLALVSLSTVTTRISSYGQYRATAEANARLALATAVMELQSALGPDQRVSAWSNILDTNEATEVIDGVTHKHYLGAWSSWTTYLNEEMDPNDGASGGTIAIQDTYQKGRHGRLFKRWLVSHPDSSTMEKLGAVSTGHSDLIDWNSTDSLTLVGEGTLGSGVAATEHVKAGLVEVNNNNINGSYAWWVGSESMKASLGSYTDAPSVTVQEDVQVAAAELSHYETSMLPGFTGFPASSQSREKIISFKTLEFETASVTDATNQYWNVTHNSKGVLADVRKGGTKYDINLLFELDAPPVGYDSMTVGAVRADMSLRDFENNQGSLPTPVNPHLLPSSWRHMREYYRLYRSASGYQSSSGEGIGWSSSGVPYTRPYLSCDLGGNVIEGAGALIPDVAYFPRMPVVARFGYVLATRTKPATDGSATKRNYYLVSTPVVVLWNPYNIEMRFKPNEFIFNASFRKTLAIQRRVTLEGIGYDDIWRAVEQPGEYTTMSDLEIHGDPSTPSADIVIPPGGMEMYTAHAGSLQRAYSGYDPTGVDEASSESLLMENYETTLDPSLALRFSTELTPELNYNGQSNCMWGMDRSGMTLIAREKSAGDGLHNEYGTTAPLLGNTFETYSYGGLAIDWLEDANTYTEIIPDTVVERMSWDTVSDALNPVGFVSWELKTAENLVYSSDTVGLSPDGAADSRCKNWLHSTPFNIVNLLQSPDTLKRSSFPYRMHYTRVSGLGATDLIQEDGTGKAFGGTSFAQTAGNVQHMIMQELPTAPITNLASFASMPLVNSRVHTLDSSFSSGIPSIYGRMVEWKVQGHTGSSFGLGIGNSYAHSMIPSDQVYYDDGKTDSLTTKRAYSDHWDNLTIANDALWDRYFCSSIVPRISQGAVTTPIGTVATNFYNHTAPLYNSRLKPYYAGGKSAKNIVDSLVDTTAHTAQAEGYKKAGAYVTVDGAFNINSTSVTAWEMLLHGLKTRKLPFIDDTLGTSGTVDDGSAVLISRFRRAASESEGASPDSVDAWKGIRKLTDSQINYLAEQMVRQVKLRGPFLNMSDFINRRLDTTDLGVCSALQAAIDWDEYNESYSGSIDASSTTANSINNIYKQAGMMITTPTATYPNVKAARGSRFAGVPGYVMASDLLQGLGNVITPRCDTFTVRAYGEAKNAKGEVVAKAWCEAVVHRTPDYVDSTNDPWDVASDDFGNDLAGLSNLNRQLGRRMRVVSFRWLKEDEV